MICSDVVTARWNHPPAVTFYREFRAISIELTATGFTAQLLARHDKGWAVPRNDF